MKSFLFFLAVFIGFSVHAQKILQIDTFKAATASVKAQSSEQIITANTFLEKNSEMIVGFSNKILFSFYHKNKTT